MPRGHGWLVLRPGLCLVGLPGGQGPAVHQILDLLDLDRDLFEEIDVVVLPDQDVIFETHPQVLVADVDPGLHRENHPLPHRFVGRADIMHVEPEGVADVVHVVFLHERFLDRILRLGRVGIDQAEPDQFDLHQIDGLRAPLVGGDPGAQELAGPWRLRTDSYATIWIVRIDTARRRREK